MNRLFGTLPKGPVCVAVGMPGEKASIAMKCVAQMQNPVDIADTASQTRHMSAADLRT